MHDRICGCSPWSPRPVIATPANFSKTCGVRVRSWNRCCWSQNRIRHGFPMEQLANCTGSSVYSDRFVLALCFHLGRSVLSSLEHVDPSFALWCLFGAHCALARLESLASALNKLPTIDPPFSFPSRPWFTVITASSPKAGSSACVRACAE